VVSTPSIGIAVLRPGESTESLRERADVAMYAAKRAGKAQVHAASDATPA
jgi:PleD family two-component response regulator